MHGLSQILVQMAAVLLVGRLLARVLRRLGQPAVVAEIAAGIALGPSVLGLLWPAGQALLFPADSLGVLNVVAQVGLVFFMFLVGLEFDPRLIEGRGRSSALISNAGVIAPLALGILLAWALHADLAPPGVGFLPFALFMGVAMAITAFPVLARILTERRLISSRVGAIALACAAFDDVTAWCILAFVVAIARADGVGSAGLTTALALTYAVAMYGIVRPALARLGPRGGHGLSADTVAVVFFLVLVSALTTEWIGIHALFGGFLLGAVMPRRGGLATAIAEKCEDFVTIVLLPLFFAYSGLRTRIGLLDEPEDWAICALVIAVACVGKFGGTAIAARLTGLGWREAGAIGILMNTRGLMELVVLNIGLDLGVISERLFAMMVLMALVTTWITSPLLERIYPSDEMARDVEPRGAPALLLCLSDPAVASAMVRVAAAWVGRGGGAVWALHLRRADRPSVYLRGDLPPSEEEPLDAVATAASAVGISVVPLSFPSTDPAADIASVAEKKRVPLVLLGTHRSALRGETLGGTVRAVAAAGPCDVAVLLQRGDAAFTRVTYLAGEGPDGDAARRVAERLARSGGLPLREGERSGDATQLLVVPFAMAELAEEEGGPSVLFVHGKATP